MKIVRYSCLSSTMDEAERVRGGEETVIVAERQTGGKGTKGRSFSSDVGGVYFTRVAYYGLDAKDAFLVMSSTAVGVCKTLESFGLQPKIKWANDVFLGRKKVCGILIKNTFSGDKIARSVIGVGVNINNKIPDELKDIAVSASAVLGKELPLKQISDALIENTQKLYAFSEYEKRLGFIGENVVLHSGENKINALIKGVQERGNLIVETDEGEKVLSVGEVSVRLT